MPTWLCNVLDVEPRGVAHESEDGEDDAAAEEGGQRVDEDDVGAVPREVPVQSS